MTQHGGGIPPIITPLWGGGSQVIFGTGRETPHDTMYGGGHPL
jgi:hypothetical protein